MGMFDMGGVKGAKVVSNSYLRPGIHHVIFKGIQKAEMSNTTTNAIELQFEAVDGSGIHNERLFEPRSAERTPNRFNSLITDPSEAEQFQVKIKQVIEALDPELGKQINEHGEKFSAPNFDGFLKLLKKYLDPKVGTETWIKLVPNGKYASFPGYPAKCTKDGSLIITTTFIGENLVLSAYEKTQIDNALAAKPTPMKEKSELDDLKESFPEIDSTAAVDDNDDLPF